MNRGRAEGGGLRAGTPAGEVSEASATQAPAGSDQPSLREVSARGDAGLEPATVDPASLRARLTAADVALAARFDADEDIDRLLRARGGAVDGVVRDAWSACIDGGIRHGSDAADAENEPGGAEAGGHCRSHKHTLALFAVGGYGRGELFPQSDIDLLVLGEAAAQCAHAEGLARFFALLWDAGLPVGHAVRSPAQTAQAAREDITVLTAQLEARLLCGDAAHIAALADAIAPTRSWAAPEYFEAKREEQRMRHARFGDTSDNLEPNLKDGPGGLRDLQTLRWMAMRVAGVRDLESLAALGQLGADEDATLERERRALSRLRFGLHLVAGRREERLRFDHQKSLAARLGHSDDADNLAVEQMMQGFYRSAALVQRIGERVLQRFEEQLEGEGAAVPVAADARFELRRGYLAARDPAWPALSVGAASAANASLRGEKGEGQSRASSLPPARPVGAALAANALPSGETSEGQSRASSLPHARSVGAALAANALLSGETSDGQSRASSLPHATPVGAAMAANAFASDQNGEEPSRPWLLPQDAAIDEVFALFAAWASDTTIRGLHSQTARSLAEALPQLPAYPQASQSQRDAFMALLRGAQPVKTLERMARLGVLGRWLPAFARVSGRMQFDLFHVYTVDQHTLAVLRNVAGFASGQADERFAIAHDVWPRLHKPELLLLAALFHDIAKGRGGDHSELGAVDARAFCSAHGLSEADTALVAWLVEQHLLMSVTAQKQDIADPEVIHRFADRVGDRDRLDYLYLLTCADIAGTSPKLWNAWKDRLLADLYAVTRAAYRRGLEHPIAAEERTAETRKAVRALLAAQDMDDVSIDTVLARLPEQAFLRGRADQVAWQAGALRDVPAGATRVRVRPIGGGASLALEVFVHSPDRDGLFAAIVATLDRLGLAIQRARVLDAPGGAVFDVFEVLPSDAARAVIPADVERKLQSVLSGPLDGVRPARRTQPRHLRHFRIAPRIAFDDAAGGTRTALSLVCTDRPGLLAHIAQVLRAQRLRVHDARIATFGEKADDVFQITDERDRALDPQRRQALHDALLQALDGEQSA